MAKLDIEQTVLLTGKLEFMVAKNESLTININYSHHHAERIATLLVALKQAGEAWEREQGL